MTRQEIIKLFLSKHKNRTVSNVFKYGKDYLVVAPQKGLNEFNDFSDPTFIVSTNGKVRQFLPMQDFDGYRRALEGGEIK